MRNTVFTSVVITFVLSVTQFNSTQAADSRLPQTTRVKQQLSDIKNSINSVAAKAARAEKAVESARKEAQNVAGLVTTIRRLDDKVARIKRQLDTLTRIPQLRLLKPLVANLATVQKQLHNIRKKADQANRNYLQPMIQKLKSAEKKMEAKVREIRGAASKTSKAISKLNEFSNFVAGRGYKRHEVMALETIARQVGNTLNPARQSFSQLDRELGSIERDFKSLSQKFTGVNRAKSAVAKLDRSLKAADKVAGDIDRVLSKTIKINLGIKKFSFTVRKVIESPGKILDVALKPLQKLASKALSPVLNKAKIKISVPKEITALNQKFDQLRNMANSLNQAMSRIEKINSRNISKSFLSQLDQLVAKTTSQLARR